MPLLRSLAFLLVAATADLVAAPAQAAWPERTVTIVSPFAAGGINDILARLAAERLNARLGQPFIVENVAGAAGAIGAQRVARAAPDGYTLFLGTLSQIGIGPAIAPAGYDPIKDFRAVAMIATSPFVITSGSAVPATDLAGFVAHVKARPGQLTFGSSGVGTLTHLSAAMFLKAAGLDMAHVPYRGVSLTFQDLLAGHIGMLSGSPVEVKPFIGKEGIRLLGITSEKPSPALPGVPPIRSVVPLPPIQTWNALLAPAATPEPVVALLSAELIAAEHDPAFLKRLDNLGVDPAPMSPDELARMIRADVERWSGTIRELGLEKKP